MDKDIVMRTVRLICTWALLGFFVGCQAYSDGSKRTVGEFADDAQIKAAVKFRLLNDPEVKGLQVGVSVAKGVVTLKGRVPSDYARKKALRIAGETGSVASVEDRLTIVE
jgi:osmotically-inducible protein OsmY|tara:strand:+ start:622 stop:951 length:330 start_codon:yes stop_codon:yes gene_type:complete